MLQRAPVLALELVEAGRIDEVVVLARQHVVLVDAVVGQHELHRLAQDHRLLGVGVEVEPELVAQARRRVAVAVDQGRALGQHGAVVGGDHHRAVVGRERPQDVEQRAVREPRPGHRAERRLVGRQFLEDVALGAPVGEDVDEVEHHAHQRQVLERADLTPGRVRLVGIVDLGVLDRLLRRRAQPLELEVHQLALVAVLGPLVVAVLLPEIRMPLPQLRGQQPREDRVARVGRGRGQDRDLVVALDLEPVLEQRLEREPLVEPHAVDDDEHHAPPGLEVRRDGVAHDVGAEERPLPVLGSLP